MPVCLSSIWRQRRRSKLPTRLRQSEKMVSRGMRGMLLAPLRSRSAHIVKFRAVFPDIPQRTQRADVLAEMRSQSGYENRKLSHMTLPDANEDPASECREARVRVPSAAISNRRWPRSGAEEHRKFDAEKCELIFRATWRSGNRPANGIWRAMTADRL